MKKLILPFILFATVSCSIDLLGFIDTTDVDKRFADSQPLPEPSLAVTESNFSIVVLSDEHVYYGSNENFTALKSYLTTNDKFVILCGDNVQNGAEEDCIALTNYLAALGMPWFAVPGNHDIYSGGWDNYLKHVGRDSYTLSTGSVRLVALDSASGTLGGPQRRWLESVLTNAAEPVRIVWTHFEFFSPGVTELQQYTDTEEIAYLMRLFETSGVDIVLTGHSHKFDDRTVNGVRYITADDFVDGGAGSSKQVLRLNVTGVNIDCETFTLQR